METVIAVGFGAATLECDGRVVLDGERISHTAEDWNDVPTFADAEQRAASDPDHDWRVVLYGPLHNEVYQRQGVGEWLLVESGQGFA